MVTIYTTHYNRLDFLHIQYNGLLKYCKDDFSYVVINNGINEDVKEAISAACAKLGVKEIRCVNENRISFCSHDHIMCLENIHKNYISIDKSDLRVLMDNDVVPYKNFSFFDQIEDKSLCGLRLEAFGPYLASIFTIYNKDVDLTNFEYNAKVGDTGSGTGTLIKNGYSVKYIKHTAPIKKKESDYVFKTAKNDAMPYLEEYMIQFISDCFVHFYRGTGWDNGNEDYYSRKLKFFTYFLENHEQYNVNLDENVMYETAHIDEWLYKNKYKLNLI